MLASTMNTCFQGAGLACHDYVGGGLSLTVAEMHDDILEWGTCTAFLLCVFCGADANVTVV